MTNSVQTLQSQKQQQVLSLFQQQSLKLLEADQYTLYSMLMELQESNPLLDAPPSICQAESFDALAAQGDASLPDIPSFDRQTLAANLREQLPAHMRSGLHAKAAEVLLRHMDNDTGYLCCDVSHIQSACQDVPAAIFYEALRCIRSLTPSGACTRDVTEFLIWQAETLDVATPLFKRIVTAHMTALCEGRYKQIAQSCGASAKQVTQVRDAVAALRPYPAYGFGGSPAAYIQPDVSVTIDGGAVSVKALDEWSRELRINPAYTALLDATEDDALRAYLREKLAQALEIKAQLARRGQTLDAVCRCIFNVQKEHLTAGQPLLPLSVKSIAEAAGVSASTVSRCLHGKYALTPIGVKPLRYFVPSAERGPEEARTETNVDAALREIIKGENVAHPYSDRRLSELLFDRGFSVSRRTIAKYRARLRIADASARRS